MKIRQQIIRMNINLFWGVLWAVFGILTLILRITNLG